MKKESKAVEFYKSLVWLLEHPSDDPADWDVHRKMEKGSTYHTTDYVGNYAAARDLTRAEALEDLEEKYAPEVAAVERKYGKMSAERETLYDDMYDV